MAELIKLNSLNTWLFSETNYCSLYLTLESPFIINLWMLFK